MREAPSQNIDLDTFKRQVTDLINRFHVFTDEPGLEAMEIGEVAFGNAAQGAGLVTIYAKANRTQIIAINVNTSTLAVTAEVIT